MVEILDLDALRVGLRGSLAALPHLAAAGQPGGAHDRILIRRGKCGEADGHLPAVGGIGAAFRAAALVLDRRGRSEEHTSELQSLMRISYAVFCLKKKKHTNRKANPAPL